MKEMQIQTLNDNETKLEKMTRFISENGELTEKLKESENLRKKFLEKCSKQDESIRNLVDSNKKFEESIQTLKKQIKDISSLKSHNVKIFEDKINTLNTENEKLKKEAVILKSKLQNNPNKKQKENQEEEEINLEPINAKPYLFGPIDKSKC